MRVFRIDSSRQRVCPLVIIQSIHTRTSCSFLHTASGAVTRANDRDAGLGAWSDAEIARAIRSGVSRDGRLLYWQGMPWDHFSNLDEEDVASVIAFLRLLPPIARKTPGYRSPAPDDCPIYTFWTVPDQAPGCR